MPKWVFSPLLPSWTTAMTIVKATSTVRQEQKCSRQIIYLYYTYKYKFQIGNNLDKNEQSREGQPVKWIFLSSFNRFLLGINGIGFVNYVQRLIIPFYFCGSTLISLVTLNNFLLGGYGRWYSLLLARFRWRLTIFNVPTCSRRYNLCQGTLGEVRCACEIILRDVYNPSIKAPIEGFDHMVYAMIEGVKPISPMLDTDAFIMYANTLCGVTGTAERLKTRYSRFIYNLQTYTHEVLLTKRWLAFFFRPLLNYNMKFSMWLNANFPIGAACKFGFKVFSPVQPDHSHGSVKNPSLT